MERKYKESDRGNVLFLILIAVALFAALSYAISLSMRTTGKSGGEEVDLLAVSRLLDYGSNMQASLDRLRISSGADVTQIYIENNGTKWSDDSSRYCCLNTIAEPKLGLFHPDGGGLIYQSFEDIGEPFSGGTKYGHTTYVWVQMPGVGSDRADLVAWTVALKQNVCEAINKRVGIPGIPAINFSEWDFVTGDPVPTISPASGSASDIAAISGHSDLCFRYGDGRLFYQRVLKEG